MKINIIAQICKRRRIACLFDRHIDGEVLQYISDGAAMYPVEGLPYLTREYLLTVFSIGEKDREKWIVNSDRFPDVYNVEDVIDAESRIETYPMQIAYGGVIMQPLMTSQGIRFIDARYLAPMRDVRDVLELYERRTQSGELYIVAKAGMILQALMLPLAITDENFTDMLIEVAGMVKGYNRRAVDPSTGEVEI